MLKSKTFWTGVLTILAALVTAMFGPDEALRPIGEALRDLLADEKLYLGLGLIFGRQALAQIRSEKSEAK